jgi:hypothetical protein
MKFLLDESFPFALSRRLRGAGKEVEHVIALGQRGGGDDILRKRLNGEALVFLTHDQELDDIPADFRSQVVISLLPQYQPLRERVAIWCAAIEKITERRPLERLFEILPSGELVAWEILEFGRVLRGPI